ncbi:MAG: BAPKO_0422 family outer member beta-barrel protein [Candidatus Saccharicenans sp.]
MRKKIIVFFLVFLLSLSVSSRAQEKKFGLGIILGEPTGVIFKYWTSRTTAFDIAGSWSFVGENSFHLHADYLYHNFDLFKVDRGKLPVYYGIGARLSLQDRTRFGVRLPLGLSYMFDKAPFDIFLEIGPVLDLVPATEFNILGFIGFRYYF